jgi:hypothetical protein
MPRSAPFLVVGAVVLVVALVVWIWPRDAEPDIDNPASPEASETTITTPDDRVEPAGNPPAD